MLMPGIGMSPGGTMSMTGIAENTKRVRSGAVECTKKDAPENGEDRT